MAGPLGVDQSGGLGPQGGHGCLPPSLRHPHQFRGSPLVMPCLPPPSLTGSWLPPPPHAVIITAFDLTDMQTLEHTRQVWGSAAPVGPLGPESCLEGSLNLGHELGP